MKRDDARRLPVDLALVHYPVLNRRGETIGAAVTNLDLHDIARAARTYGIDTYWLVTPFREQRQMVGEILDHWRRGHGALYNPLRSEALSRIGLCADLEELLERTTEKWGEKPLVLATSAGAADALFPYGRVRGLISDRRPLLLLFGTGWGLAPEALVSVDGFLPPLHGPGEYNHLSVRSAASIILDRLLADRDENEENK